ncbi:MAG TPA: carbon storage regulator [Syntrophus sp. (in: bacteria)]|jgi:carbon storage regulator|nr:carbon storage regulator [Syntrophus sp. (in: bacteria)]
MLILTRKLGEVVAVGDDIKIVIVDIKGKHVRIGVEAPRQTKIYREELYQIIREQNQESTQSHSIQIDDILSKYKNKIEKT